MIKHNENLPKQEQTKLTRRNLLKSAAWSAPAVVAVSLPQHAQATAVIDQCGVDRCPTVADFVVEVAPDFYREGDQITTDLFVSEGAIAYNQRFRVVSNCGQIEYPILSIGSDLSTNVVSSENFPFLLSGNTYAEDFACPDQLFCLTNIEGDYTNIITIDTSSAPFGGCEPVELFVKNVITVGAGLLPTAPNSGAFIMFDSISIEYTGLNGTVLSGPTSFNELP